MDHLNVIQIVQEMLLVGIALEETHQIPQLVSLNAETAYLQEQKYVMTESQLKTSLNANLIAWGQKQVGVALQLLDRRHFVPF